MKNRRGTIFITGGILLILSALALTGYNLWDESRALQETDRLVKQLQAETGIVTTYQSLTTTTTNSESNPTQSSGTGSVEIENSVGQLPAYLLNPDMEMPIETIDSHEYIGILEIPSMNLILPIMNDWSTSNLKIAPCRYEGSAYTDSMILAGHNYKSHFGPIGRLKGGEQVIFTDVEGNAFYYRVVSKEVLTSTAIAEMQEEAWDLTLFTCTLGGQNRITIRCERSTEEQKDH